MIKTIKHTKAFKKDIKRYSNAPSKLKKLAVVLRMLSKQQTLGPQYNDHKLRGNYKDRRECHIEPDFLLIYRVDNNILFLERLGSHSELFK